MTKARLLLVDDDAPGRLVLAAMLEDAGYAVTEAACLSDARSALLAARFDLALLDVNLPDGRGPELVGELSRSSPGIAVAVLSGEDVAPQEGVHLCITKACAPSQLVAELDRAMAMARAMMR
jgi:DNA-binding NtrC family response regulator